MVEDFKVNQRIGRAEPTGTYEITRLRTRRAVTKFRETYCTPSGDYAPEKWRELILLEVTADHKEQLLERIKEHCRTNCMWLKTEDQIEEHALNCLAYHAYEHWDDFQSQTGQLPLILESDYRRFVRGQRALF